MDDKLYIVNRGKIYDYDIIYESPGYYFIYIPGSEEVSRVRQDLIIYDNGDFAKRLEKEMNLESVFYISNVGICGGVFIDKELAEEYAEFAGTYGRLCVVENKISELCEMISKYNKQLDEARAEREVLLAEQGALADG